MTPDNERYDDVEVPRRWHELRPGALIAHRGALLEVVELYWKADVAVWLLALNAADEQHYLIPSAAMRGGWKLVRPAPACPDTLPITQTSIRQTSRKRANVDLTVRAPTVAPSGE